MFELERIDRHHAEALELSFTARGHQEVIAQQLIERALLVKITIGADYASSRAAKFGA
jgi:hypothetical protein